MFFNALLLPAARIPLLSFHRIQSTLVFSAVPQKLLFEEPHYNIT